MMSDQSDVFTVCDGEDDSVCGYVLLLGLALKCIKYDDELK